MKGGRLRIIATRLAFPEHTHPLIPIQELLGRRLVEWAQRPLDERSRIELELPGLRSRVYHIGRMGISDLYLPSFRVRRRHAELEFVHPGQWMFRSLAEEVWDLRGGQVQNKTLLQRSRMLLGDYSILFLTEAVL